MTMRLALPFVTLVTLSAVAAYPQKPAPAKPEADKETFETVCGACHPAGMVSEIRSETEWRETVADMVKTGAKGTEAQLQAVIRYLLANWTKVNVNTASAAEIAPVLAVDETTAAAIVRRRDTRGPFRTIDELKQVPGIDAAALDARKDRIAF